MLQITLAAVWGRTGGEYVGTVIEAQERRWCPRLDGSSEQGKTQEEGRYILEEGLTELGDGLVKLNTGNLI